MKRSFILIFFVFLFILVVVGSLFRPAPQQQITTTVPTPTPVKVPSVQFNAVDYQKVFPNPQIASVVKQTLKESSGSAQQGEYIVISFPTDVDQRPNLVYEKNGVAQYVLQEVTTDNSSLTDFLNTHPQSQSFQMFDSPSAGSGFSWHVFPQDGIAFLANKDFGYAIKILYFPQTTKNSFIQTDAKVFQLTQTDANGEGTQETFQ